MSVVDSEICLFLYIYICVFPFTFVMWKNVKDYTFLLFLVYVQIHGYARHAHSWLLITIYVGLVSGDSKLSKFQTGALVNIDMEIHKNAKSCGLCCEACGMWLLRWHTMHVLFHFLRSRFGSIRRELHLRNGVKAMAENFALCNVTSFGGHHLVLCLSMP